MQRFLNNPRLLLIVTATITAVIVVLTLFPGKLPDFNFFSKIVPSNLTTTPYTTLAPDEKAIILVFSARKDAAVTVLEEEKLRNLLENELQVFNKVYNKDVQKDNLPLKRLFIILTDSKQLGQYKDVFGNVIFSYAVGFQKDYAIISIYLPGDVVANQTSGQMFAAALMYVANVMNQDATPPTTAQFNAFYERAKGLFEISQKTVGPTIPPQVQELLSPTPTTN